MVFRFLLLILLSASTAASEPNENAMSNWPQWRGPLNTGEAFGDPPLEWDENTNIRWKVPLGGLGHATPVVWGERIFVLRAVPVESGADSKRVKGYISGTFRTKSSFSYEVLALNRADGRQLWKRTARVDVPHEGRHEDASWASPSPVTDGKVVIAFFGSQGLYCYDMDGKLLWERDFGRLNIRYQYGESSSAFLYKDRLIVQWDHEGDSFLAALDLKTGEDIWRVERNDGTSWASPLVVEHDGKAQVIVCAIRKVRAYDAATGEELWFTRDMTAGPIPSPVSADGLVYLMGAYRESILQAISFDRARGNAEKSDALVWDYDRDTSYVASPLLYRGSLYFIKDYKNMLSCLDAGTGEPYYARQRLNGITDVYASPVAAKGRVYVAGRNGVTLVIRHGPSFEVLAKNTLNDRFDASPVIVGKELYLRGHQYLYCIASE